MCVSTVSLIHYSLLVVRKCVDERTRSWSRSRAKIPALPYESLVDTPHHRAFGDTRLQQQPSQHTAHLEECPSSQVGHTKSVLTMAVVASSEHALPGRLGTVAYHKSGFHTQPLGRRAVTPRPPQCESAAHSPARQGLYRQRALPLGEGCLPSHATCTALGPHPSSADGSSRDQYSSS
jgi:hypothetical protein